MSKYVIIFFCFYMEVKTVQIMAKYGSLLNILLTCLSLKMKATPRDMATSYGNKSVIKFSAVEKKVI